MPLWAVHGHDHAIGYSDEDEDANVDANTDYDAKPAPDRYAHNPDDSPKYADGYPLGRRAKLHRDAVGRWDGATDPNVVARPGDTLTVALGPAGVHAYTLANLHGVVVGHGELDRLDFRAVTVRPGKHGGRGGDVLPVRAERDPGGDADRSTRSHAHRDGAAAGPYRPTHRNDYDAPGHAHARASGTDAGTGGS